MCNPQRKTILKKQLHDSAAVTLEDWAQLGSNMGYTPRNLFNLHQISTLI